ncbi:MAG: SLC13 family permease [Azospirillaceae bacterium]
MSNEQYLIFGVLAVAMAMFIWGRFRFDVVALATLAASTLLGLVPMDSAFVGFGHPAVVLVAVVLALTRAFIASGIIDRIARMLGQWVRGATRQTAALTALAAVLSMFMNNVGALALLMPVAIKAARDGGYPPSRILMPLAFGSILGGMVTLIGTPPNIIVATYRGGAEGSPFGMFDFTPVGAAVLLAGLAYIVLIGWRLLPKGRTGGDDTTTFEIADYVTELSVEAESPLIGKAIATAEREIEAGGFHIIGLFRGERPLIGARLERIHEGDVLLAAVDEPNVLGELEKDYKLTLVPEVAITAEQLRDEENALVEAVVAPGARVSGRTPRELALSRRFNVNLLALAREGQPMRRRLRDTTIRPGDVMLIQTDRSTLSDTLRFLGCLPLAERELKLTFGLNLVPIGVFAAAIAAGSMGLVSLPIALLTALLVIVLIGIITPRDAYEAIDWPVIMLLGAMIPVGTALSTTGATDIIAGAILSVAGALPVWAILAIIMVVTMTLSDVMNNAATAVVMAPISISIAGRLDVSADPFLMAVAVGASCAFLTPIGHQNNTLIMGPGGYKFGDYWRMGLPLEVLVVAVGVPVILLAWPL